MRLNSSLITSLATKTTGAILIVAVFVDLIFAIMPYRLNDFDWLRNEIFANPNDLPSYVTAIANSTPKNWWFTASNELIDRGQNLIIGVILLVVGEWIQDISLDNRQSRSKTGLFAAIFAVFLGLLFIIIAPFQAFVGNGHLNKSVTKITEKFGEAETQVKNQATSIKDKSGLQKQLAAMEQAVKSGKVAPADLQQLQAQKSQLEAIVKVDPAEITKKENQALQQINQQKQAAKDSSTIRMWQTSIRNSIVSLLLAAGFSFIGFNGIRQRKQ